MDKNAPNVVKTTSIIKTSRTLNKLVSIIVDKKSKQQKDEQITEIEQLKVLCQSSESQIAFLACQSFAELAKTNTLDAEKVLSIFISIIPYSNQCQYAALLEGAIEVLLHGILQNDIENTYECPYNIMLPKHPLIVFTENHKGSFALLSSRVNALCNHFNPTLIKNSIAFLRPVFLHIFCNVSDCFDQSRSMWSTLTARTGTSDQAHNLMFEILAWKKTPSPNHCIEMCTMISEAIEMAIKYEQKDKLPQLIVLLMSATQDLVRWGYDPRQYFNLTANAIMFSSCADPLYLNAIIYLAAVILRHLSPAYIPDLMRLLKLVVVQPKRGNTILLFMIADQLLQWVACPNILVASKDVKYILQFIISQKSSRPEDFAKSTAGLAEVEHCSPNLSIALNTCRLANRLIEIISKEEHSETIKEWLTQYDSLLSHTTQNDGDLLIRSLLLSELLSSDLWNDVFQIFIKQIGYCSQIASEFLMPFMFKLSTAKCSKMQIQLIRGLISFAADETNIPKILHTIKILPAISLKSLALDLHVRLWRLKPRTFMYLQEMLEKTDSAIKDDPWEYSIARAIAVKNIIEHEPLKHSEDLLKVISDILNGYATHQSDFAIARALDAITLMCEAKAVNILSIWKSLGPKFDNEERVPIILSLCRLLSQLACVKADNTIFESRLSEFLERIWGYTMSESTDVVKGALIALQNFPRDTLHFDQIPINYRVAKPQLPKELKRKDAGDDVQREAAKFVSGDCWIQLLQNVPAACKDEAIQLVSNYIRIEIEGFRRGIYALPENRPEPSDLRTLPLDSPLRAVIHQILAGSKIEKNESEDLSHSTPLLIACLRCVAPKFSRPLPPFDWCFLHNLLHHSTEIRLLCYQIAINQMQTSGTAKRLIENVLYDFEACTDTEQDIRLLFKNIAPLERFVLPSLFKSFVESSIQFAFDQSSHNNENDLFENTIHHLSTTVKLHECNAENLNVLSCLFKRLFNMALEDSRIFHNLTKAAENLPRELCAEMISSGLTKNRHNLKKALSLQMTLFANSKDENEPFFSVSDIFDALTTEILQEYFRKLYASSVGNIQSQKKMLRLVSDLIGHTQKIAVATSWEPNRLAFVFDLFAISLIIASGCSKLVLHTNELALNEHSRYNLLPIALASLDKEQNVWKSEMGKIFEFLHFLSERPNMSTTLRKLIAKCVICSHNNSYFETKNVSIKFIEMIK